MKFLAYDYIKTGNRFEWLVYSPKETLPEIMNEMKGPCEELLGVALCHWSFKRYDTGHVLVKAWDAKGINLRYADVRILK